MEVSIHSCVFGPVLIGSDHNDLLAVELGSDADECYRNFINRWRHDKYFSDVQPRTNMNIVGKVISAIDTGIIDPALQIRLSGVTWFQRKVLEVINSIPPGSTMTYHEVAKQANRPNSARAVGNVCHSNPIAILVPCHRVTGAGGKNGGYKWGESIKQKLLDRERI